MIDERDLALRRLTYKRFAELGRAPSARELAAELGVTGDEVTAGWRRLHDSHALVLNPSTSEIRMANPFSAVPTAYRVYAAGRWWYANCAWDAFGIFACVGGDGRIECSCPDCGEPLTIGVNRRASDRDDLLFHCLVPADSWWADIVYT